MNQSSVQLGLKRFLSLCLMLICICPSRQWRKNFPFVNYCQFPFRWKWTYQAHYKPICQTCKTVTLSLWFLNWKTFDSILNPSTTVGVLIVFLSFLLPPRRRKEPNEPWSPKDQTTATFRDSWNEFCEVLCYFVVPHGDPIFVNQFWSLQGASYKHHGR